MKQFTLFLMIFFTLNFSQAQNSEYTSLWKQVDKFEADGLPKSALEVVDEISEKARKNNDNPQFIKALLFKSKYALILEEDAQLTIINDFKAEIQNNQTPTKQVLENMLATMYWQYFQQNRWKYYNRSNTSRKVDETDFRTWDLETLFSEIQLHYNNSLQDKQILQQTPIETYDAIINEQKGSKVFRPTLYDLLAHNALEFYKTDENSITKPAYKFEIDNLEYLRDASSFLKLNLQSKDSSSLQLQALKIYQELIQFHTNNKSTEALVDVDIQRLKFVHQNAVFNDKDQVFLNTLKQSSDSYQSQAVSALYDFEIAQLWVQQGNTYQPKTNDEHQWKLKEAYDLCKVVQFAYPNSVGAEKCKALQRQVSQQDLRITTESYLPIQQESRVLLHYKNIERLEFRAYKLSENQFKKFNKTYREDEQRKFIKKLDVSTFWDANLKNEGDYQQHTTEVIIPKFDNGRYLIVASIPNKEKTFAVQTIQVTNMALIDKNENDTQTYQIIDRNNGKPLPDVDLKISYNKNYNGVRSLKSATTNAKGIIEIPKTGHRWTQVQIEVTSKNEKAYFGDYYINQKHSAQTESTQYKGFIFTDRSIYRPGQTVYFKGIAIKTEDGKSEVLANESMYAILYDVNGQEVKKHELQTNEFGSVSGEFILPNAGLTGQFRIKLLGKNKTLRNTNTYISVEEYKRPKFETTFKPITETFKVNDSITINGNALAYAGSNITNAKVVYRVHRKVRYPDWYYWYRPAYRSEPQEIAHGETTTNDKGEFEIVFRAIPDSSVDKSSLPIFNYEVTADVTDINGETRSTTTIVNVGYHAMTASIMIENTLDKTLKEHAITINTQNLHGEFVPASGNIKIHKLLPPQTVLRQRPWIAPDYPFLPKDEFKRKFPYEAYQDEHLINNWGKGEKVFEKTFNTEESKTIKLGTIKKWESGQYIITLESEDKFGQDIKAEAKTFVFSERDAKVSDNQLFNISTNKDSYQNGDVAKITIASAAQDVTVTVDVEKNKETIKTYVFNLNDSKQAFEIPINQEDLGGFAVHYSFAFANSFVSGTKIINVPYPKTDLKIETTTFRDKLQPGTDETWSFKIKGSKGDKVSAELLASMYDASLDQFKSHDWNFNPIYNPTYNAYFSRNAGHSFGTRGFQVQNLNRVYVSFPHQAYDQLNWFGLYFGNGKTFYLRGNMDLSGAELKEEAVSLLEEDSELESVIVTDTASNKALVYSSQRIQSGMNIVAAITPKEKQLSNFENITIRKNLQETAFFFPQLQTDNEGNVSFRFTTPEALTQWKLQLLAHTKTLESAVTQLETVTQKELMVIPNAPRFLRHGDEIVISTKIANLTDKQLIGQAKLELTNALTGNDITSNLIVEPDDFQTQGQMYNPVAKFSVDANGNTQVSWNLFIPDNVDAIQYKIVAKAGDFSDGEQNALPVLSNRMLVTETLPMWIKSNETRTFTLDKLKTNTSSTLKHHKLTLEITSNPAWYAVQALPYLMEYPYDCNEQTFSRYYANALASHIANSNPRIQEVFQQWRNTDALLSNLEKNQDLKSILIQETPWLRDAQSETEQKKRIALLFDLNKMNNELQNALRKLEQNQMNNGAWPWFNGGRENRFITQHIVTGFGHLKKLNVNQNVLKNSQMIINAINYLDTEFIEEYQDLTKYSKDIDLSKDHLSPTQVHYLYMRSFFPEIKQSKKAKEISEYYISQIQKYWLSRSLYSKGMMTLITNRLNDTITAGKILKSLKENSITNDELGMYWKDNTASWYWYQAPIETQALMIEAFSEAGTIIQSETQNLETIDNLKIWLLKNKQTNKWETTKATTEAVYALLLQGSDWLSVTEAVDVLVGDKKIEASKLDDVKIEAGTGYYKTSWNTSEIKPEMANVTLTKKGDGIAWGSLYWQYFEDLDNITSAETPLKLKKKLFKKVNTDTGEEITEITPETQLQVGDLVRVRIELRSDRDMEFIHMKDMRASGLEPVNVLSQYKWQDGLGYYESTKDAATNFFFDFLPKGIYVFEYDLRVNNAGNMSNGITTIQSMYAPEFSSHSEGVRILVN